MLPMKMTSASDKQPAFTWVNPMHMSHWFVDQKNRSVIVLNSGQALLVKETLEEIGSLFEGAMNGVSPHLRPPT